MDQNPLCKTLDMNNGGCTSCWQGYVLANQNCVLEQQQSQGQPGQPADPYCIKYNNNGMCIQCSSGYFYNGANNICNQLDPLCKSHDMNNGNCQSCYPGYSIKNFKCVIAQAIQIANCNIVTEAGTCAECL